MYALRKKKIKRHSIQTSSAEAAASGQAELVNDVSTDLATAPQLELIPLQSPLMAPLCFSSPTSTGI